MKTCIKCNEIKDLDKFGRHPHAKNGRTNTCRDCKLSYSKRWNKDNAERNWIHAIKNRYGLSLEEWNGLFEKQSGCCAICDKHQSELDCRLVVDHCHSSGFVRGLLCRNCNSAIGMLEERPEILDKAKSYLAKPKLKVV